MHGLNDRYFEKKINLPPHNTQNNQIVNLMNNKIPSLSISTLPGRDQISRGQLDYF